MTECEALLAAIHAAPEDDLPRLVFADWLEGTDTPANVARAAFIRLQIELAKLESAQDSPGFWDAMRFKHAGCAGCSDWCRANGRQYELLATFTEESTTRKHQAGRFDGNGWTVYVTSVWRRGFIHTVRGPLALLREHLPDVLKEHPVERAEPTDFVPHRQHGRLWIDDFEPSRHNAKGYANEAELLTAVSACLLAEARFKLGAT